jgi:hypothetical protein
MEVCRIHLSADKNIPVLSTTKQPLRVGIFNETEGKEMTFARIRRVIQGLEVARDLSTLYNLGVSIGIQCHGDPKLSYGMLHQKHGPSHNCIVVSFSEHQQYVVYCIHKSDNWDIYQLYEAIQGVAISSVTSTDQVPA